jgi:quercetin dioxygenase-like cupin family protein
MLGITMETSTKKRVIRAVGDGWEGVPVEGYRPGAAAGVTRQTIIGGRKERREDDGPSLELRYFELAPGAVSRLEKHEHEHYVIVKTGEGYAIVDDTVTAVGANDVVYVGAMEIHQFVNRGDRPFGFYCIVDATRDFSREPDAQDLARLAQSPAGAVARPFAVPPPKKP